MKKIAILLAIISASVVMVCFSGCSTFHTLYLNYFSTDVYITVKCNDFPEKTKTDIENLLADLDNELNVNKQTSAIYTLNTSPKNTPVTFSDMGIEILTQAKTYYTKTDKNFNPAIYPLSTLWKLSSKTFDKTIPFNPPTPQQVEEVKPLCDYDYFTISGNTVTKSVDNAQLDLGGIAKGYATDKIGEILLNAGFTEGYVNIGGSSIRILSLDDKLGVVHPKNDGSCIIQIEKNIIQNKSISSSGDYIRYYMKDNVRYCHIIGKNGAPVQTGIRCVTMLNDCASQSDALTTAIMCYNHNPNDISNSDVINFVKSLLLDPTLENASFFIVYEKDNVKQILTNEKQDNFTLLDNEFSIIKF